MTQDSPQPGGLRASGLPWVAAVAALLFSLGCVSSSPQPAEKTKSVRDFEQAMAIRNIGLDHLNNWRTAMAIRELRRSEELNPDDVMTILGLAEAYQRRKLFDDSERYFKTALAIDPDFLETYIGLSNLYIQMERYEESIQYAQHLVDEPAFTAPWRALTNRGYAELMLGRLDDARRSFEEALEYRGFYGPARLSLGIIDAKQGRKLEAIENFQWIMDKETGELAQSEAAYRLGEIYMGLGRREVALQHFTASAELAPYGRWGRRSKDYLKLLD